MNAKEINVSEIETKGKLFNGKKVELKSGDYAILVRPLNSEKTRWLVTISL